MSMNKDTSADGLRGIASLSVVTCHYFISFFPLGFTHLYPGSAGSNAAESKLTMILNLPVLSLLWNGNLAVSIFFVLSGYVLTKSFFTSGDIDIIRVRAAKRYFRFVLPVLASVIFSWAVLSSGYGHWKEAALISGSSWLGQFWTFEPNIINAFKDGVYGTILNGFSTYNPTLWTMKIEIFGSFLVFAYSTLMRRGVSDFVLFLCVCVIVFSCDKVNAPYYMSFIMGAYINLIDFSSLSKYRIPLLLISFYFSSADETSNYAWLSSDLWGGVHATRVSTVIGSFIIVLLIVNGMGRRFFDSKPMQVLGRLSFSIYLVHFPIILSLSSYIYIQLHNISGSGWMIVPNFLITITVVLLVAAFFTRIFDDGSVKLANSIIRTKSVKSAD